jgi:hypothetical protein
LGAALESEYLKTIEDAGFTDAHRRQVGLLWGSASENTKRVTKTFKAETITITASKPD